MKRLLAISDIHGHLEKFDRLLEKIQYDKAQDQLLLLGDYVDRGPCSRGVLDKVIQLCNEGAIALIGNHEKMMLEAFQGDQMQLKRWYYNGGIKTLQNYGYTIKKDNSEYWYTTDEWPELIEMNDKIKLHIEFLQKLPYYYETDTHLFVHAGVQPNQRIDETDPHTLVWIRDEFHKGYTGEKTVVFGHTPVRYLHESKDVYFGENRIIGIDGGCAYGGRLNCLEVESSKVYYVE